jgi:hypothetical protein
MIPTESIARFQLPKQLEEILGYFIVRLDLFVDDIVPKLLGPFASFLKDIELQILDHISKKLIFLFQVRVFLEDFVIFNAWHEAEHDVEIDDAFVHILGKRKILTIRREAPKLFGRFNPFLLHLQEKFLKPHFEKGVRKKIHRGFHYVLIGVHKLFSLPAELRSLK